MLSDAGYVAFAPDLFGRELQSRADGAAVVGQLAQHPTLLVERLGHALQFLAGQESVDRRNLLAVGFCFGGFAALELVRSGADLRAVACVHGGLVAKREVAPGSIKAAILACVGADDPFITPEQRGAFEREMTAAEADWQLVVYSQTMHAFTNPKADPSVMAGCAYNPLSDRRAWAQVLAFFDSSVAR
jgi:dienelactone hydrolase